MLGIRLDKRNKTIVLVNKEGNLRLNRQTKTVKIVNRPQNISIKRVGKPGPPGINPLWINDNQPPTTDYLWVDTSSDPAVLKYYDSDVHSYLPIFEATGGGDKNYVQTFITTDEVTVNHHLSKLPAVSVIDTANDEVEGSITYVDINTLIVRFSAAFSGTVVCN